jgi:hypothetical protein
MKGVTLVYSVNSFFRHASHGQKYNFLPMVFWGMFGPFLHIAKTLSHVLKLSVTSISFTITTVALFHGILSFPCKASAVPNVKCNQARVYLQRQTCHCDSKKPAVNPCTGSTTDVARSVRGSTDGQPSSYVSDCGVDPAQPAKRLLLGAAKWGQKDRHQRSLPA